ncbi:MAG: YhdH/YhfP family quinone oxidoreductase [Proteobacteria bacterium]|jgi:acrylyl-CoA reductase (NADPH)|nr:YhdH/YhfP family quinone oxidoreductase [Pseudomonadota bacterium]
MSTLARPESLEALRSRLIDGRVQSTLERLSPDELSPGEVLVRTLHAGVNYKDCLAILGKAKIITDFPRIAGIEAVGQVIESSHPDFRPGDPVLVHGHETGIRLDGGFAEVLRVPAAHLQQVPAGLTPLECAILGVPAFTAAMALERFEELGLARDSGPVAVSGAGGAVGMMTIAILARAGYEVAAITRNLDRAPVLQALGATEVIDAAVLNAPQRPLEKPRFAAAVDNVGGAMLSWLMRSMKDSAAIAVIGNAGGNTFEGSGLPFFMRRLQMFGVIANAPWPQRRRLWQRLGSDWKPDMARLLPHVHHIPLNQLMAQAERQLQGGTSGRTLVTFAGAPA